MKRGWRPRGKRRAREPLPAAAAVLRLLSLPWGPPYSSGCFRPSCFPSLPRASVRWCLSSTSRRVQGVQGPVRESLLPRFLVSSKQTSHPGPQGATSSWDVSVGPESLSVPTGLVGGSGRLAAEVEVAEVCVRVLTQLCPTLRPHGCSPPGSSVRGILQARILGWAAMPSSRRSSRPGVTPACHVSCTGRRSSRPGGTPAGRVFTTGATWEAQQKSGKQVTGGGWAWIPPRSWL